MRDLLKGFTLVICMAIIALIAVLLVFLFTGKPVIIERIMSQVITWQWDKGEESEDSTQADDVIVDNVDSAEAETADELTDVTDAAEAIPIFKLLNQQLIRISKRRRLRRKKQLCWHLQGMLCSLIII